MARLDIASDARAVVMRLSPNIGASFNFVTGELPSVMGIHEESVDGVVQERFLKMYADPEGRPGDALVILCHNSDAMTIMNHPHVALEGLRSAMCQGFVLERSGSSGAEGIPDMDLVKEEIYECCARAGIRQNLQLQDGISVAHDMWVLRYIVKRVATRYGLEALDPNMIPGVQLSPKAGILVQFSTESMRNERGYEAAIVAVDKLQMRNDLSGGGNIEFKIFPYYDGEEAKKPSGYIIDVKMAPSVEMADPYMVTSWIAETVILWKPTIPQILLAKSLRTLSVLGLDHHLLDDIPPTTSLRRYLLLAWHRNLINSTVISRLQGSCYVSFSTYS